MGGLWNKGRRKGKRRMTLGGEGFGEYIFLHNTPPKMGELVLEEGFGGLR